MKKTILTTLCLVYCQLIHLAAYEKPNVLIILVDDLGWRDTGYMGSDFYETPNIDQLAAEGMKFSNAYSAAANCAPARACLLSGQYTPRHKVYNVGTEPRGKAAFRRMPHIAGTDILDPGIKTWAQVAKDAGYKTASMGKWHLSHDPVPYGFDINIGGTHSGSPPKGYYPPHPEAPGLEDATEDEYLTDRLTEEAVSFIRKNKEDPWLLYLSHFAVHTPLDAKKELVEKYTKKHPGMLHSHVDFATMIQAVDDGVGLIMDTLKDLDLDENTLIIFYSDNGGYGPATDMAPLKGYKGTYYEGGIRVPLAIRWPKVVKAGSESGAVVTGVDFYPTICKAVGLDVPFNQEADGMSLLPILRGDEYDDDRAVYWHFPAYLQSYKGVTNEQRDPLFRSRPCSVIRRGEWKLHYYFEDGGFELYNLKNDIGETFELSNVEAEVTQGLFQELVEWLQGIEADIPYGENPDFKLLQHRNALQKFEETKTTDLHHLPNWIQ